jgi:hypothetical protein
VALPKIQTAIPLRRYKYGEYTATLLGDISSSDDLNYCFMMALVKDGGTDPEVYITHEETVAGSTDRYRTRVLTADAEHIIDQQAQALNQTAFCDFALNGIQQMFGLSDEQAVLLS